jgi:hypothetical protein
MTPSEPIATITNRLEADLDAQVRSLRREVRWITIVGLFLVCGLAGYFTFVVRTIHREVQPRGLAQVTGAYLSEFLATTIKDYGTALIRLAPDHVSQLLDSFILQALGLIRDGRFFLIGWLEERLTEIERLVTSLTDAAYTEHVGDLKFLVQNIKTPAGKKAFEEYFATLLSEPLAKDSARIDIESLDLTLRALQSRLDRLVRDTSLTADERIERELLLLCREYWDRLHRSR